MSKNFLKVFLDHLYNSVCDEPNTKIIDVFICKLRKKILKIAKNKGNVPEIKTIWGRGYIMSTDGLNNEDNKALSVNQLLKNNII